MDTVLNVSTGKALSKYLQRLDDFAKCGGVEVNEVAAVVRSIISDPATFVFSEVLEHPAIQELGGDDLGSKVRNALRLFAYGTLRDYNENRSFYPELTGTELKKLSLLTVVTLSRQSMTLPYSLLREELNLKSVRSLEDLLIEGLYSSIITGRLDHQKSRIDLTATVGRDLDPAQGLDEEIASLGEWGKRTEDILTWFDQEIEGLDASLKERERVWEDQARTRESSSLTTDHQGRVVVASSAR